MEDLGITNYAQLVELYVKEGKNYMDSNNILIGYRPLGKGTNKGSLIDYMARTLKKYFQSLYEWSERDWQELHPEWAMLHKLWTS